MKIQKAVAFLRAGAPPLSQSETSRAIEIARVVLLVSLVFVHYNLFPNTPADPRAGIALGDHPVATFLNAFIRSWMLGLIPLLSAISGWLFFAIKGPDWPQIKRRIGARFRTLYLFLIVWNLIYLAVLFGAAQIAPAVLPVIEPRFVLVSVWDYVNAIFGITAWPINTPFWFVRDLFLAVLLSPLLWLLLKRAPLWGAALMAVIWLGNITLGVFFRTDILAFFYFGGLLRVLNVRLEIGQRATIILTVAMLAFIIARTLAPLYLPSALAYEHPPLSVLQRGFRLVGVVACWGWFLQAARTSWGARLARYGRPSIFIFASHFLFINAVKLVLWPLMPGQSDFWMMAHYALSVGLTLAIIIMVGALLARLTPGLFAFLTGGRVRGEGGADAMALSGKVGTGFPSESAKSKGI